MRDLLRSKWHRCVGLLLVLPLLALPLPVPPRAPQLRPPPGLLFLLVCLSCLMRAAPFHEWKLLGIPPASREGSPFHLLPSNQHSRAHTSWFSYTFLAPFPCSSSSHRPAMVTQLVQLSQYCLHESLCTHLLAHLIRHPGHYPLSFQDRDRNDRYVSQYIVCTVRN